MLFIKKYSLNRMTDTIKVYLLHLSTMSILCDFIAVDIQLTFLIWHGDDDVTESDMIVVVSVVRHGTTDTNQEHMLDITKCT